LSDGHNFATGKITFVYITAETQ